jgi:hypothetical protein
MYSLVRSVYPLAVSYRCHDAVKLSVASLLSNHGKINVRVDVSITATMKNVVFWDIKPQFIPHMKHITSPLQSPAG